MSRQQPSPQQDAIYNAVTRTPDSLLVVAVAGAGKTTTLTGICERIPADRTVIFCAYNKAIATEIGAKLVQAGVGANVKSGTFHSFGYGALSQALKVRLTVDGAKCAKIARELRVPDGLTPFVTKLVSLAKQRAVNVLTVPGDDAAWYAIVDHFGLTETLSGEGGEASDPDLVGTGVRYAQEVLRRSNEAGKCGQVDFDDMIYLPLVYDCRVWQRDYVLVDEAQDTNPARRALARKMLKPSGRLIAVGDPHQAIYGFTGADSDALELIKKEFRCVEFPLTVTYRCPKAVVALAQRWVSHITAADSAPEGEVTSLSRAEFRKVTPTAEDVVLCRLTKPLVELAYEYIGRGVVCRVEGRDIGQGLIKVIDKVCGRTGCADLGQFLDRLDAYQERETGRLLAKGQETAAEAVDDRCATLRVIAARFADDEGVDAVRGAIHVLFGDTPEGERAKVLTLSTVHKAKGREWGCVYLFGREKYMPSKWARQAWQADQELNLMYVAVTRAKATLVEVAVS